MPGASLPEAALTAGSRIGRYFGLISALPSALFVLYVFALLSSGAWNGAPDLTASRDAVTDIGIGELALLLVIALTLSLVMHPFQFSLIQMLEGYWGMNRVARRLAVARMRHHRARFFHLRRELQPRRELLDAAGPGVLHSRRGDRLLTAIIDSQELARALMSYPKRGDRIMPTRFGNALRRYEDLGGQPYNLDAIQTAPHLAMVGQPDHVAYLGDARGQLDLAARVCALALLASVLTFVFFIGDGFWLLLALAPYAVAYLAYRGAVSAAHEYGAALAMLIDLDRFRLYEALHLTMPADTHAERIRNSELARVLASEDNTNLVYDHRAGAP